MRLFAKKNLVTIKLNPGQIISLYTLPLVYDNTSVGETMLRYTSPTAYSIAFDDYIKFLNMETTDPARVSVPLTKITFLNTDGALHTASSLVLPLIYHLEEAIDDPEKVGNFSTIHPKVIDALNVLYQNYLLNLTVLQAKLIEFLRWDPNKGNYAPVILPSLGVFERLKNMYNIQFEYEDDNVKSIKFDNKYDILHNINVGTLEGDTVQEMLDNYYPDINLGNYLYKGIHQHAIPFGYYIEEDERREFDARVQELRTWEEQEKKLTDTLDQLIRENNRLELPRDQFIAEVIQRVQNYTETDPKLKPFENNIYITYMKLNEKTLDPNRPKPLTEKEAELLSKLDALRKKPRWKDRYPKYTYDELIRKIEKRISEVENSQATGEFCLPIHPLEEEVLQIDDWVLTLASILGITQELYEKTGNIYLLDTKLSETFVDEQFGALKLNNYYLTDMFS